jgi:polyisoprenoid-binding protein YceI
MHAHALKLVAVTTTTLTALAMVSVEPPLRLETGSRLTVTGTSTVRSFECEAKSLDASIEATTADAVADILAGQRGVGAVDFRVAAGQLDCNNGTMNGHMYKAIKSTEHPNIVFRLASYDLASSAAGVAVAMKGTLLLGGVEKPITLEGNVESADGGALRVTGAYELNMKDFDLKPPTLMFGAMRVGEKVTVNFELLLKP